MHAQIPRGALIAFETRGSFGQPYLRLGDGEGPFHSLLSVYRSSVIHLNGKEVRMYSPLLSFLNEVQRGDGAMTFLPMVFRLERQYGGVPHLTVSNLSSLYSCLNHSCLFNVASSLSQAHDIAATAAQTRNART